MSFRTLTNRRRRRRRLDAVEQLEIRTLLSATSVVAEEFTLEDGTVRVTFKADTQRVTSLSLDGVTHLGFDALLSSSTGSEFVLGTLSTESTTLTFSGNALATENGGVIGLQGTVTIDASSNTVGVHHFVRSDLSLSASLSFGDTTTNTFDLVKGDLPLLVSFTFEPSGNDVLQVIAVDSLQSITLNKTRHSQPTGVSVLPIESSVRTSNASIAPDDMLAHDSSVPDAVEQRPELGTDDAVETTLTPRLSLPDTEFRLSLHPSDVFHSMEGADRILLPNAGDQLQPAMSATDEARLPYANSPLSLVTVADPPAGMAGLDLSVAALEQAAIGLAGLVEDVLLTIHSALQTIGLALGADSGGSSVPVALTVAPVFPGGNNLQRLEGGVLRGQTVFVDALESQPFRVNIPGAEATSIESLTLAFAPRHGQLIDHKLSTGELRFVPDPGFDGPDSAVWSAQLDDGQQVSGTVVFIVDAQPTRMAHRSTVVEANLRAIEPATRDLAFSSEQLLNELLR
ncbi:MAG: hypothetical protein ACYTGL_00545 [Planctomycetota bacterium]|jgi:hypothetical protein